MNKKSGYLLKVIVLGFALIQLFPAVGRLEPNWKNLDNTLETGLRMVMWGIFLVVSLFLLVMFLQNLFQFIAVTKIETTMENEAATQAVEKALRRIRIVMHAIYQAVFGMGFVGLGCVVIFAPREKVLGGDSPVPAGILCVVLGGVYTGFVIWKTIKKWKAMQNEGMNQ